MRNGYPSRLVSLFVVLLVATGMAGQATAVPRRSAGEASLSAPSGERAWAIQTVDVGKSFEAMNPRSLALDAAGHPHLSAGGTRLYYAWHDGVQWHLETVDGAIGVGAHSSLALDASGYPHISYYDSGLGDLKYAEYDGAAWHLETVDSPGNVGYYTALALDGFGNPSISYLDWDNNALKYAHRDATGWHVETVDGGGQYTSLVLDGDGHPHISYCPGWPPSLGCSALWYAYQDESGWHNEPVSGTGGTFSSLVLDASGAPAIAYRQYPGGLQYVRRTGSGWQSVTVDSAGGQYSSLALDPAGFPHITYLKDDLTLWHAYQDIAGWQLEIVDPGGYQGYWTSLALDGSGYAHVSYLSYWWSGLPIPSELRYAYQDAAGWHTETLDRAEGKKTSASLSLDPAGRPHLGYSTDYGVIQYAYYDAAGWHREAVETASSAYYVSLALDAGVKPHLSYYTMDGLKYAYKDGAGWHISTVDSACRVGNLVLDPSGFPHIAYVAEGPNSRLKYAYQDASGWHIETVDGSGDLWSVPSLVLDSSGQPNVGCVSQSYHAAMYAYKDGNGWHIETVGPVGCSGWDCGGEASIALDTMETPHIAYTSMGTLTYATRDSLGWSLEALPVPRARSISLALDSLGRPHLSYCSYLCDSWRCWCDDLQYAYYDGAALRPAQGGAWQIETVDSYGEVGAYSSLALDAAGRPHIGYYEALGVDLKYARLNVIEKAYLPLVVRGTGH